MLEYDRDELIELVDSLELAINDKNVMLLGDMDDDDITSEQHDILIAVSEAETALREYLEEYWETVKEDFELLEQYEYILDMYKPE